MIAPCIIEMHNGKCKYAAYRERDIKNSRRDEIGKIISQYMPSTGHVSVEVVIADGEILGVFWWGENHMDRIDADSMAMLKKLITEGIND